MIGKKIKRLLAISESSVSDYAKALGCSQPNISNKIIRNTWTMKDLLLLAEHTDTELAFLGKENQQVIIKFEKEDLDEIKNKK